MLQLKIYTNFKHSVRGWFLFGQELEWDTHYYRAFPCFSQVCAANSHWGQRGLFLFLKNTLMPRSNVIPWGTNNMYLACSVTHCPSYLGDFDGRAIASGEPTADEADFVQWWSPIDLGHCYIIYHGVLGEGAGADEVVDGLAFAGEPAGTLEQSPPRLHQAGG